METYFVKNGLLNGEPGIYAKTCGFGVQQRDGWYYLPANATDGIGPFSSKEEAIEAGEDADEN